jgi:hypothetical protein
MPTDADLQDIQAYLQTFVPPRKIAGAAAALTARNNGRPRNVKETNRVRT